jgi:lysophospholipase L1-like esterase
MHRKVGTVESFSPRLIRLIVSGLLIAFLLACVSCQSAETSEKTSENIWAATWGASPFTFQSFGNAPGPEPFENQTVRQIVRISVGGKQVRVRFSNEMGTAPLVIGAASIAVANQKASVKPDTLKKLTFGGSDTITIPAGAPVVSDPLDLPVKDLSELAISIYLPEKTVAGTVHMDRTAYISSEGDFTLSSELPDAAKSTTQVFLSGIYVTVPEETGVIVALGDSITDGAASTPGTYNSWPHHLAKRLAQRTGEYRPMAVVNQGISGNQLLRSGMGANTLARFDRDVLSTPGLTHIVLLIGINDIGSGGMTFPGAAGPAPAMRTPGDIIAGYRQLIARTHSMSPPVKIFGATLTPFEGTFEGYYSPEKDKIRMAVNDWIRTSGEFDGVIDFDKAIQDPENPGRMASAYDSGDKLHPGDAGYSKMAESINMSLFD